MSTKNPFLVDDLPRTARAGADAGENVAPPSSQSTGTTRADLSFNVRDARLTGLVIMTTLAVVYTLYFGREIILPVVMAAVLNLLLEPLMRLLNGRLRLPMPLAAFVVIALVFAVITGITLTISLASPGWTDRAPESIAILKQKLAFLASPISFGQEVLSSIENMGAAKPAATVAVAQGNSLPGIILFGTASTLGEFFSVIIILYFMLATGDRLLRGLIEILPRFSDKRRAVEIAGQIQFNITRYLMTVALMNAAVGLVAGLAMWACGLSDPVLWGAVAFLLNFVPIIGPLMGIVVFFVAGLIALPWPFPALVPVLAYALIHLVEGEALTPMLVARRFELNPVLVILSLFFWHSIWGIPGALLAVPLLAISKILADRIEPLKSLGHLIGA